MKIKINGQMLPSKDNKYILVVLILSLTKHFQFQSIEKIRENVLQVFDMFNKGLEKEIIKDDLHKKEISSLKRKLTANEEILLKINRKEVMIKTIYNFLLSLDGMSTLNGFKVCTPFGDILKINPEKESMHKIL